MAWDALRFWLPVVGLFAVAGYSTDRLVRTHFNDEALAPRYGFSREVPPRRGRIYDSVRDGTGEFHILAESTRCWEYRLDPVAMTAAVVRVKGQRQPRTREAMALDISRQLKKAKIDLDYQKVLEMTGDFKRRYQLLGVSGDLELHAFMTNTSLVAGIRAEPTYERQYYEGRRGSHVLGSVNAENDGSCGIEQRFNRDLKGIPGSVSGKMDARHRVLWDKNVELTPAIDGADVYLTTDSKLQVEAERALLDGIAEFGADAGWCVVLDAKTGEVLAMASQPDFDPLAFGKATEKEKVNRVTSYTYEPGSVMKVITAAAAIEAGIVGPDTMYSSDRFDKRYKSLPGDGSHKWDPQISVRKAIAKSSNIVIGKLGCDLGPKRLHAAMLRFGFGRKTGIELPGEEVGILRPWQKWDQLTWSRAPIGQGVSVTALQMASAYQAIANDGVRMPPRIVRQVLDADGNDILDPSTRIAPGGERVLSRATARTMRDMMLKVNTPEGTARLAAIQGYSVAGKTGTAQKVRDRKYVPGLYRATFCGIVPSGVVKRDPSDAEPVPARVVILVTLDFEKNVRYHQGGNSSGRIFKRIAQAAMLHLNVAPDRPDEVNSLTQDEFDRMLRESEKRYVMELDPEWDGNTDWMEQPAEHAAAAALN